MIPSVSGYSIKDVMKRRIVSDMIRFVQPPSKWKIMVVDPLSIKVLNATLKMYDILDENVTLVEMITKKRQPYPQLEAIYFLSCTPEAIDYLIVDFLPGGGKSPLYVAAHLFFLGSLPDQLMQKITSSGVGRYIKNLKELYVDFLPLEQRVFSLNSPASFFRLFSPDAGGIRTQTMELDQISKQLACFMATIGDVPYVRFFKPSDPDNNRSAKLANMFVAALDNLARADPSFVPNDAQRGTLVIVDRSLDMNAPILHEFTYQAMSYDLLPMEDGKFLAGGTNNEEDGKSNILVDESDPLWVQLRHTHIAESIQTIMTQFNKFLNENKAASSAMGKKGPEAASLKDMKETLAAMPQFQELKQKYSLHINLTQECMNTFERRKLAVTAGVEQDMATGETAEGGKAKNVVTDLVPLLDDPSVTPLDKVRLLMLYILFKEGVQDDDRRKLLDHANIPLDMAESITNMALLGVKLKRDAQRSRKEKKAVKSKKGQSEEESFELSRYVPALKLVVEDHITGSLEQERFPYLGPQPTSDSNTKTGGTSLRSTKPSWQKKGAAATNASGGVTGNKITVFVVGGMSYSEVRSIYEVAAATGKEILIGSTHLVTPNKFVEDLKNLRIPAAFDAMIPDFGFKEGPKPLPSAPVKGSKSNTPTPTKSSEGGEDKKKKKKFGIF